METSIARAMTIIPNFFIIVLLQFMLILSAPPQIFEVRL